MPRRHGRREGSPAVGCERASLGAEGGDQERGTGTKRELALGSREIPPRREGPSLTSPPRFCTPAFSSPAAKQHTLKVEIQKERALPKHKTLLRTYASRAERGKPAANPKMKKNSLTHLYFIQLQPRHYLLILLFFLFLSHTSSIPSSEHNSQAVFLFILI